MQNRSRAVRPVHLGLRVGLGLSFLLDLGASRQPAQAQNQNQVQAQNLAQVQNQAQVQSQPVRASQKLRSGFHNPLPGGEMSGYAGDTGLDISAHKQPVFAIAAGTLDYAERGHTVWRGPKDTDFCVRIELDAPIPFRGRRITHIYYAHLSAVQSLQAEGAPQRRHVAAGEQLGISGVANGVYHLHLGLILDGRVDQEYYDDIVREWDVRAILGGYRKGQRLPAS